MNSESSWYRELNEKLRNDPIYVAENVALKVAMQVNEVLRTEGLTKKLFAEQLGVSQPYVSQILGGQTNMTILTLAKVACALGLDLSVRIARPSQPHLELGDGQETYLLAGVPIATSEPIPSMSGQSRSGAGQSGRCFDSTVESCNEPAFVA
jgi:transcriptional regulator with XRE-family HTH domain